MNHQLNKRVIEDNLMVVFSIIDELLVDFYLQSNSDILLSR
jgi:hypothetical protein